MEQWYQQCSDPQRVEYVLSVHESRLEEFMDNERGRLGHPAWGRFKVVTNHGPDTNVSQVNFAASHTTGKLIIGTMDDLFAPRHWDDLVIAAVPDIEGEYIVQFSTGSVRDAEPLINAGVLTRKRYERYGYIGHPSYESMYVDDDMSAVAVKDRVLVQRLDIEFLHKHPCFGKGEWDDIYALENRQQAMQQGYQNFTQRKAAGFPQ